MVKKYIYTNRILIGCSYVSLAYACFLAKKFSIDIVDTDKKNRRFKNGDLSLKEKKLSKEFKLRRKIYSFLLKQKIIITILSSCACQQIMENKINSIQAH